MARYTDFQTGWNVLGNSAIDKRILLTKAEMKAVSDETASFMVPDIYFAICNEDGELYLYNVSNTNTGATGKYKKLEAQGRVKDVLVNSESVLDSEGIANITFLDWALVDEAGNSLQLTVDSEYKVNAILYDKNGVILSSSQIDLPIEQLIVSVTYDSATKELVITLKNGQITRVPIGDIISGLATEAALNAEILRATTAEELLENMIDSEGSRIEAIEDRLPTGTDELATKAYVDSEDNLVKAYADAKDAVVKQYVDDNFVKDVQIEGVSKVVNNVANLTTSDITNAIKYRGATNRLFGLMTTNNQMWLASAKQSEIDNASLRNNLNDDDAKYRQAITQGNIDYAVKAALTDGKGPAYSDAEKLAARTRIGVNLDELQKKLTAGDNITIDANNKISANVKDYQAGDNINFTGTAANPIINAVDTKYTAGEGLKLSGNEFNTQVDNNTIKIDGANKLYVDTIEMVGGPGIKIQNGIIRTDESVIPTKTELAASYQGKLIAGNNIVISGNEISAVQNGLTYQVVNALPTTGVANVCYLLLKSASPVSYDMYMWLNNAWSQIGSTAVDLSNYYTKGETSNLLSQKQEVLNSGYNIKTVNNQSLLGAGNISITGDPTWGSITGTLANQTDLQNVLNNKQNVLTAGSNININNGIISATDTTYQAGSGIIISGNIISATGGGTGGANWGSIGGTLSNQTDLQQALNNKANVGSVPTNVSQLTNDSGYITSTYHDTSKQDTLVAGTNIQIVGNVISATGTTAIDWNNISNKPDFKTVATSGSYNDLTNKPTIPTVPTAISAFTNDAGYITSAFHDSTKQNVLAAGNNITISGNVISATDTKYTAGTGIAINNNVISSTSSSTWGNITGDIQNQSDLAYQLGLKANTSSLASVATSGSYNDLSNKPSIPVVNDGALTLQKNGSSIATFTANNSGNVTCNIKVPTFSYNSSTGVLSITDN